MGKVYLGLDFGTSNCSLAYVYDDPRARNASIVPVDVLSFEDSSTAGKTVRLPTVVSSQFDDKRIKTPLVGWDVHRQFDREKRNASLLRHGKNLFASIKSDFGSYKVYPHSFSSDLRTPESVAAAIVEQLLDQARTSLPDFSVADSYVFLTVPASLNALARKDTRNALTECGIAEDHIELIDEPVAALVDIINSPQASAILSEEPSNILIFDYYLDRP